MDVLKEVINLSPIIKLVISIIFFIVFTILGIVVSPIILIFGASDVVIIGESVNEIRDAKHKKENK